MPTDLLLVRSNKQDHSYDTVMRQETWPTIEIEIDMSEAKNSSKTPAINGYKIVIKFDVSLWKYDGSFQIIRTKEHVRLRSKAWEPLPIESLRVCPLQHVSPQVTKHLLERGKMFWACRHRKYVTYSGWDHDRGEFFVGRRSYNYPNMTNTTRTAEDQIHGRHRNVQNHESPFTYGKRTS